jgi:hypothetical protein
VKCRETSVVSRRGFLRSLGATAVAFAAPSPRRVAAFDATVVATDFGARPDGSDAAPGFAKAIAEVARRRGGRLVVLPGRYEFFSTLGVGLNFFGLRDVEIEAQGAEFVFRGLTRPFVLRNCRNLTLRGLRLRWARVPFSQGDLVDVADDRRSAVIALDEITPFDGFTRVKAFGEYERSSGLIATQGLDVFDAVQSVEGIDPRRVRLHFNRQLNIARRNAWVLRHAIYEAHVFDMRGCSDMRFDEVVIHSAPGMGFVAALSRNITVSRCEIAPPEESGLLMSTTADAVHFANCGGDAAIENCRFAAMGDDGVNVTTSYWRIAERPDKQNAIVTQWRNHGFLPDDAPVAGDVVELASGSTLEPLGEARVDEAHVVGSAPAEKMALHFATDAKGMVGDLACDEAHLPNLLVQNCRFENNRARGVLAHKNARIENNLFLNQSAQGVLLAPDEWWMEGPEVANVKIVGNVFDGVDRWELKQGAIKIDALSLDQGGKPTQSPGRPNHDIVLKDNIFRNIVGPDVVARAIKP